MKDRSDCRNKKKIQFKGKQVMPGERKKTQKQTIIKQIDWWPQHPTFWPWNIWSPHLFTLHGILNSYLSQIEGMRNWCAIVLRITQRERTEPNRMLQRSESPSKLDNIIELSECPLRQTYFPVLNFVSCFFHLLY